MSPTEATQLTIESKLAISEYADLFGFPAEAILAAVQAQSRKPKAWNSVEDLARYWGVSKGTVYNVVDETDARVLNLGRKGRVKGILRLSAEAVSRIEQLRPDLRKR